MTEPEPPTGRDDESIERSDGGAIASEAQRTKRWNRKLIAVAAVGGVVVAGIALTAVAIVQPTAIERAGEACAGAKPLQALMDDIRSTVEPDADAGVDEDANSEVFGDLFEGVITVEDNGKTLIVNTQSQDDDALGLTALSLECVYEQLEVPKHISERIGQTRALDGRQEGTWGSFSASWGYHPNSGANVVIVQE